MAGSIDDHEKSIDHEKNITATSTDPAPLGNDCDEICKDGTAVDDWDPSWDDAHSWIIVFGCFLLSAVTAGWGYVHDSTSCTLSAAHLRRLIDLSIKVS